jgi:fumarate reductase subunit C
LLIRAVVGGEAAYRRFLDSSGNPVIVVANLISLVFVVFHAITWFNLAPRAIVVRIAGRRVPEALVVASNYIALALCSGIVVWLVLGE